MNSERHRSLDELVRAVAESYDGTSELDNLDSVALPNKRAVVEALWHLKHVLFLGFYSTRALSAQNLSYALAEHLAPAEEILVTQIARVLGYEARKAGREVPSCAEVELLVHRFLATIPAVRRTLTADVRAAYDGDPAACSIEEVVFAYPSLEAISTYRLAHELYRVGVPLIPRIWSEHAHAGTGVDIHPGATIGEGFFIDHGTGVVIGATAVLGRSVKLYQGVTLGALSVRRTQVPGCVQTKRHPTLEDHVTVYAGASIMGGDTVIGEGSVVGANVWLTQSLPPGSKLFGRAR